MSMPRILLGAASSGSGKTMITCGVLQALVNRGLKVSSFKCGPDYIDPMFHSKVIGTKSKNLDTFFTEDGITNYLFARTAQGMDISVMEGVMGYYDGLGGVDTQASAYDLARVTQTPAVLIVNTKGMSLSVLALIKGFLEYEKNSQIKGVILNKMSPMIYEEVKAQAEAQLGVKVYGYVPVIKDFTIESRHLGLVMPDEVAELSRKLNGLAGVLEKTLDIDGLLALAGTAPDPACEKPFTPAVGEKVRIAVARDGAFCFYYQDNLDALKEMGAELAEFSPVRDHALPEDVDGILLGGGYPELYAGELSENLPMLESIRGAVSKKIPLVAECGGFMYLHRRMEGMDGVSYPMAGIVDGEVYRTDKLGKRFGYIELTPNHPQMMGAGGEVLKGHEFHYFDSTSCGGSFHASKPLRNRGWDCIHGSETMAVGFPHLYYYSNLKAPFGFLRACERFRGQKKA